VNARTGIVVLAAIGSTSCELDFFRPPSTREATTSHSERTVISCHDNQGAIPKIDWITIPYHDPNTYSFDQESHHLAPRRTLTFQKNVRRRKILRLYARPPLSSALRTALNRCSLS